MEETSRARGTAIDQRSAVEWGVGDRQFLFEWNLRKGAANLSKHGVSFEIARSVFRDPHIMTVGDLEHGSGEERWFSIGCAANGAILSVVYVWTEVDMETSRIRIISARKATRSEFRQYREGL
jgi:uncharacterized DUF497 family protein